MTRPSRPAALALIAALIAACGPAAGAPTPSPVAVATPSPMPTPSATPKPTPSPSPTPPPSPTPSPTPSLVPGDVSGVLTSPELANRLPLAVMIDDSRASRPQSGFNAASAVYQSLADGYESRYMLVFQEADTRQIGPVRSARFFLVQWGQEYGAALAHYGGDDRTRWYLRRKIAPSTDVDGLGRGNPAYHRIKSRRAPHNAYTSTKDLRRQALKLGGPETTPKGVFERPFRDAVPVAQRGTTQRIRIPYRTNVIDYSYDPKTNAYWRSVNGKPHIDPADDRRVTTTNVVVLFQRFRIDTKIEPGHSRPDITTIGTGKAWVFSEGRLVKGTWRKQSDTGPTRLFDADGKEIPLVRGRTFYQVVPPSTKVTVRD